MEQPTRDQSGSEQCGTELKASGLCDLHLWFHRPAQGRHGRAHNVARLFTATAAWFHFSDKDVWSLFHSYAFDFSVWEIWGALLYGGRLVVVPRETARSPQAFYELVCQER